MKKIDVINWGQFSIKDLFETTGCGTNLQVPTGANIATKDLTDGEIPRVTVSNINNGITGYYSMSDDKNYRVYENFISVSFLGTIFYHPYKASLDMKVHCLKPTKITLNKYIGMYLISVLKKKLGNVSYSNQISSKSLPHLIINLPINSDGFPDYKYMENYMRNLELKANEKLEQVGHAINSKSKRKLDSSRWKRFHLYDDELFFIDSGNKLDKSKMTEQNPSVNFVGRSGVNNGITTIVDRKEDIQPYNEGYLTLSLGGEYLGSCFIQHKPFYTSQNVNVLIPKWDMPYYCKLFICAVIFKESRLKYKAFVDELNRHVKTDFSIPLPITDEGRIDWVYIENYMKNIELKAVSKINNLTKK